MTAVNKRESVVNSKLISHPQLCRGVLGVLSHVVGLIPHVSPLIVGPNEEELDEIGTLLGCL